jgi:hypothetical protein
MFSATGLSDELAVDSTVPSDSSSLGAAAMKNGSYRFGSALKVELPRFLE